MVDDPHSAQAFDSGGEGPDCHLVTRHGHRYLIDDLGAEVLKAHGCVQHSVPYLGVVLDALGQQVRSALRVSHLVSRDERQNAGEYRLASTLCQAPEEVRGEMLGQHELDESLDELVARVVVERTRAPHIDKLGLRDGGIVFHRLQVAPKDVEVLESLERLEREAHSSVDIIPRRTHEPPEVDRMKRLDQRRVAHGHQKVGRLVREVGVDRIPVDVALHRPRSPVRRLCVGDIQWAFSLRSH